MRRFIKLDDVLINPDFIAFMCAHTIGRDRYTLLPGERCVLDIRTSDNTLMWTRQFDTPVEMQDLLNLILDEIGYKVTIDAR